MKNLFILLFALWSIGGVGQNKSRDSLWVLQSGRPNLISDFQQGYNAFYLDSLASSDTAKESFRQQLINNQKILFIGGKEKVAKEFFPDSLKISNNLSENSEEIQAYHLSESQFNYLKPDRVFLSSNSICKDYNLITADSLKSKKEIDDFFDHLLYERGIVPDVIGSPFIDDIPYLKSQYCKKPIYKARVTYNGEELRKISWKEFPHLETCGVFRTSDSTLSPQKRGYMFSPDIYNFTDKNTKISGPKNFRAIKYELDEELSYSLPLKDGFSNLANPESKSTATDVEFIKDIERDEVAYFNGSSSYIDIRSEEENKLEEISITAWVKPDEVDGSLSLVGKGEAFSAKIYNGRLQFTATGIEDHATSESIIEKEKWNHVGFVYVPRQKLYFYLNGNLIEEIPASDIRQTDHALLIGTNLWGQYYSGAMSKLKIWDRALSDEEIENVYLEKENKEDSGFLAPGNWWVFALGLGLFGIGIFYFTKKRNPQLKAKASEKSAPVFQKDFSRNSITVLNGFKVWNHNGEDITYKFSPRRRELLILILLFTIRDGGITSKKLSDILWPGFTPKNKKNNRSTQIKEIRKIFNEQVSAEIIFEDKKWQLQISESASIDVFSLDTILPDFLASKKASLSETEVTDFARVVSRGALLPQVEEEWLDAIKSEYNSRVLDLLTPFLENELLNNSEKLEIIEAILAVDPLFETAVKKKVSCLLRDGKYGSAKKVVENYKKLYESYYNETIDREFLKLVK